jgi:hypothetical protein
MPDRGIRTWIYANWPYAGLTACLFLLLMTPLLWSSWSGAMLLVYLQLPLYMIHQVEEHHRDRFRAFVNRHMAGGRDALTTEGVVIINLGGVWAVDLVALYLAYFVRPGLGLIAVYLPIVNGLVHVAGWAGLREYNPGLVSAVTLLLPAGAAGWWLLVREGCTMADHAWGLGVAIAIHVAIVVSVRRQAVRLMGE